MTEKLRLLVAKHKSGIGNSFYGELLKYAETQNLELTALREKCAELQRQIDEANRIATEYRDGGVIWMERAQKYGNVNVELNYKLAQAEQRILESQRQEPVAWMAFHKDTAMFTNSEYTANVRWCRRRVYPLVYAASVEEAVKDERKRCVRILLAQDVDPSFKNRMADAIREGGEK